MPNPDPVPQVDAFHLRGADSFQDPRLPAGFYQRGWNVINRGGIIQTRPGSSTRFNLPSGKLQGFTQFVPRRGPVQLIAIVDGKAYVSEYPYNRYQEIPGLVMDAAARHMFFAHTEQVLRRNADDSLTILQAPRRVLFIQDGLSAPTWWDGVTTGRCTGVDTTPQGTAMAWSGNRLWVARGNQVFASDFANPFSFVEQFYMGGSDSFLAPGRVTAMAELEGTGQPQLLVFTPDRTITVQSNIQNRELWLQTQDFIRTLFPSVGCISHRSVVPHFGQLWWFSQKGLTNFDLTRATNEMSLFVVADNEMITSKSYLDRREGAVAGGAFGNFLLMSVPYSDKYNRHTWVLDQSSIQTMQGASGPAWTGVWTGFWPVEWVRVVEDGQERVFTAITDGTRNQVIEFSGSEQRDSGRDIEAAVELRVLTHESDALRVAKYAELHFSELKGEVDIRADWRGLSRGTYKNCLLARVRANQGNLTNDRTLDSDSLLHSTRGQSRRLWTQEIASQPEVSYSSCGIEQVEREQLDYGFNLMVSWCGKAALRSVRFSVVPEPERRSGKCATDETEDSFVRFDGLAARNTSALEAASPIFYSTQVAAATVRGVTETAIQYAVSLISQQAADKQALQAAQEEVARLLIRNAPSVLSSEEPN